MFIPPDLKMISALDLERRPSPFQRLLHFKITGRHEGIMKTAPLGRFFPSVDLEMYMEKVDFKR
jgi:hypothetical protein